MIRPVLHGFAPSVYTRVARLVLAGPVTRFLLPLRRPSWPPRCPACRHELVSLREARCPECGIEMPEAFVAWSEPHERAGQGAA